ncbi:SUKH-4 family immunity protein [Streptomyces syringium]|uniref:SUKH-4 family immunity protein n=1 Tax=Streptomyces syringium TaxID=76729 RepID=UPI0037D2C81F
MVTNEQLKGTFGELDVFCVPESALRDEILHPGARETLMNTGIPGQLGNVLVISESITNEGTDGVAAYDDSDLPAPSDPLAVFYRLASAAGGDVCLDGNTGEVFFVKGDYDPPVSRINTSLEHFIECMFVIEREISLVDPPEDPEHSSPLLRDLVAKVTLVDDEVIAGPAMFWQQVISFYLQELAG